jgi:hypothetical protein
VGKDNWTIDPNKITDGIARTLHDRGYDVNLNTGQVAKRETKDNRR